MGRCGATTSRPGPVEKMTLPRRLVDRGGLDDAADRAAGHDLGAPVGEPRWIRVGPAHSVADVGAFAVDDVVGAVLVADTDNVAEQTTADVDREQVRRRSECQVVRVDLSGSPAPRRRAVQVESDERLVVGRHGWCRLRRRRIGVGVAVARAEEQQPALGVVRGGGPDVPAAVPAARVVATRAGGEEACGQAQLGLGVVAVVAADVVGRVGPAHRPALEVEEPGQLTVVGVERVEAALAGLDVVDVHPDVDGAAGDDRRRLDLVAFTAEATEPWWLAGRRVAAVGARGEPPYLGAGRGVDGVDALACAEDRQHPSADLGEGDRAGTGVRRAGLVLPGEAPDLLPRGPVDGVDVAVP